jgi:hypothetical protein
MFNRPATLNTSALIGAALVTLAMLGFVDSLARHDATAHDMAAAKPAPVAAASAAPRG